MNRLRPIHQAHSSEAHVHMAVRELSMRCSVPIREGNASATNITANGGMAHTNAAFMAKAPAMSPLNRA